jgi:hypothetical protein
MTKDQPSASPRFYGRGLGRIEDDIDEAFAEMSWTELSELGADSAVYLTVGRQLRSLITSRTSV